MEYYPHLTQLRRDIVRIARIAIVLILVIILVFSVACKPDVKGTVELPPEFQGVVEVEHEPHELILGLGGKILGVDVCIWNIGTQTIDFYYEIYVYDSGEHLLAREESFISHPLAPEGHWCDHVWCWKADYEKVDSYIIVLKKR